MSRSRRSGNVRPRASQWSATLPQIAGEPNERVTLSAMSADTIGAGSAASGLEGSRSGVTVVAPRAGLKSAKRGSIAMSVSPGRSA